MRDHRSRMSLRSIRATGLKKANGRDRPGHRKQNRSQAADQSGKTASILLCSVWALNGLTM